MVIFMLPMLGLSIGGIGSFPEVMWLMLAGIGVGGKDDKMTVEFNLLRIIISKRKRKTVEEKSN